MIAEQIIMDAYGEDEICASWHTYLEDNLDFPFQAYVSLDLVKPKPNSACFGLLTVYRMAEISLCGEYQMWVMGELSLFRDYLLHFPLQQIVKAEASESSIRAITAWRYWCRPLD